MRKIDKPIFVLSVGRAGSTLVQRIINTIPDVYIYGEHFFILNEIFDFYKKCEEKIIKNYKQHPSSFGLNKFMLKKEENLLIAIARSNNLKNEVFKNELIKEFIIKLFNPRKEDIFWGFKELNYDLKILHFLNTLFPLCRFVFVVRNPIDNINSLCNSPNMGFTWPLRRAIETWNTSVFNYYNFYKNHLNKSFLIKYEDAKAQKVEALFKFLGFKVNKKVYKELNIIIGHSKKNKINNGAKIKILQQTKKVRKLIYNN